MVTRCLAASHSRCSASEGRTYANPYRVAQAAAARKEQKQVGWYHFLWLGNLQAQAEYFIRCAQPKPGDIVACDWETTTVGTVPSCADKDAFPAADADGGGQQRCGEIRMPPCRVVEGRVRDVRGAGPQPRPGGGVVGGGRHGDGSRAEVRHGPPCQRRQLKFRAAVIA
ncbi:GH25 family lysozyme [Streptomyces sp. NBC_01589]|uniref:GH25 family lysozyme n=1 Tax=unclassified Streptomyces TaxID=2593676 RepID=UPI003867FB07